MDTWPNLVERDGISRPFDWCGIERFPTRLHLMNIQQLNESDGYQRVRDVNRWYSTLAKWIGMNVFNLHISFVSLSSSEGTGCTETIEMNGQLEEKGVQLRRNWQFARAALCVWLCVSDMHFTRDLSD